MSLMLKKAFSFVGILLAVSCFQAVHAQDLHAAVRLTHSERFTEASSAYKALLLKNPNDGDLFYYYGNNFLQKYFSDTATISFSEMADSASVLFQKGVQADPKNPASYVGLGQIALIRKNLPDAQQYYSKALALLPSKTNKTSALAPDKQAQILIWMANGYVKAMINDTAKVFGWLRAAEKLDNKNYDLYIVKGDAYIFLLNEGSKAITNYNMAQYYNPQSPLAKLRVGQLWLRARNYKEALNYYYEVVKMDSTFAPAYRELGFLLAKSGRNDEAKKNLQTFVRLSAGNITARIQLINTLLDLEAYKEAINQVRIVQQKDSSNNDLNRALGYSYFELAQYDNSLYYLKKFIENAKPEKIRATDYVYYGRALAKNKSDSLAAGYLMKAYAMDHSKPELISEAAMSYNRMKKFDKALDLYIEKIRIKEALAGDYYNLGKDYYNLQQWSNVDSILSIMNTMQPEFISAYTWRARALVNLDPDTKLGLAKPVYETLITKAMPDSAKYSKDLVEAYSYLAYYYLVQYNQTKNNDDGQKSLDFCNKVLAIDPNNDKAKDIIKVLAPKIKH
jgi:tetratricopeptide (TPR) repeat protein